MQTLSIHNYLSRAKYNVATVRKEILTSKKFDEFTLAVNLHLPRFDELKVDETPDFISAFTFLEEYPH